MLNERIQFYRKRKGISQEEMAVKLNVVRQTVSKWENGLSVPDADMLIQIAELLEVSVSELLEIKNDEKISKELANANALLAKQVQKHKQLQQANYKRGMIVLLSLFAMIISMIMKKEIIFFVLSGICMLTALWILYRNLALLTSTTTENLQIRTLRITTIFNMVVLFVTIVVTGLLNMEKISLQQEKNVLMMLLPIIMLFMGFISTRLPFSKHTGLRLPWTVNDVETWNVAHRVLSMITIPIVFLLIAGFFTVSNTEFVMVAALILWIGIPAILSFVFYQRKM